MSQHPSHILIRFTIIVFLTLARQDSFLSAEIQSTSPIIISPTERFTWQQHVAHDVWKLTAKKGWFKNPKSLDQEKINKIIKKYKPKPMSPSALKKHLKQQQEYREKARSAFTEAPTASNAFESVARFMHYFEQLDDQHKLSLIHDLQQILDANPSAVPNRKIFADYIPDPPANSTKELDKAITKFIKACNSLSGEPQ